MKYYIPLMTNDEWNSTPDVVELDFTDEVTKKIKKIQSSLKALGLERGDMTFCETFHVFDENDVLREVDDDEFTFELRLETGFLRVYPDGFVYIAPAEYCEFEVFTDLLSIEDLKNYTSKPTE